MDIIKEYNSDLEDNSNNGIYMIRHKMTNRRYIGETSRLNLRFGEHCNALRSGSHSNKSFQEDFDRFDKNEGFLEFSVIAKCPNKLNKLLESYYTNMYDKKLLYSKNKTVYNDFFNDSRHEDRWISSIEDKYKLILKEFIIWYKSKFGYADIEKEFITYLLESGVKEYNKGDLFYKYPFLKTKMLKKRNIFNDTLDYIGLAILSIIKINEKDDSIYSRNYKLSTECKYSRYGLVLNIINKLWQVNGEPGRLTNYSFHFAYVLREKGDRYIDNLDLVQLMENIMNLETMFDCVYAYIYIIFIAKNL